MIPNIYTALYLDGLAERKAEQKKNKFFDEMKREYKEKYMSRLEEEIDYAYKIKKKELIGGLIFGNSKKTEGIGFFLGDMRNKPYVIGTINRETKKKYIYGAKTHKDVLGILQKELPEGTKFPAGTLFQNYDKINKRPVYNVKPADITKENVSKLLNFPSHSNKIVEFVKPSGKTKQFNIGIKDVGKSFNVVGFEVEKLTNFH